MSGTTTYQVTLSTGGQVAVTVTAEDPAEMKASLAWAELADKHLVDSQGRKDDQVKEDQVQEKPEEAPICTVHHIAMVKQWVNSGPSGVATSAPRTGSSAAISRKNAEGG